ncbi:DegV family protein [Thermotoga profunda]|uniref:DegV family protein n=1 Tax=Thermotoga profunda TaxID=1508420 RepID=UPI000596FD03|nr:DegV family protein [Thermotoga profunda]
MKIVLVFDSSIDIPIGYEFPIPHYILPLKVYVQDSEFKDKIEITDEQFYSQALSGKKVGTALPNPSETAQLLTKLSKEYDHVYIVTISSKLSGTWNMIRLTLEQLNLKNTTLIDSKSGSVKSFYVVYRLLKDILAKKQITEQTGQQYVEESLLLFTVTTLDYLQRGGRIGKAKALLGKILGIKPILSTNDEGEVLSLGSARSIKQVIDQMVRKAKEFLKFEDYIIIGGYGVQHMKQYLDELLSHFPKEKILGISRIGPGVSAHVGPEVFGLVIGKA